MQTSIALKQIEELMSLREQQKREITAQIHAWNRDNSPKKTSKRISDDVVVSSLTDK